MLGDPNIIRIELAFDGESLVRHYVNPDRPRLLFCHGTGLASDCFRPFWERFSANYDLVVMDLRGHGWNVAGNAAISSELLVADLCVVVREIRERLDAAPMFGVFHSISGVVALRAAIDGADLDGLLLFEPPLAPAERGAGFVKVSDEVANSTIRRRALFSSPVEFAERLAVSPIMQGISGSIIKQFAEALLVPREDGWVLRCSPSVEAELYRNNHDLALWRDAARLNVPVLIQSGAGPHPTDNYSAGAASSVATEFVASLMQVGQSSHFGWIVYPEMWADLCHTYLTSLKSGVA